MNQLTDMVRSNARLHRFESLEHRRFIKLCILRNVQKCGRFIELKKDGWQVLTDEAALRKIDNIFRYRHRKKRKSSSCIASKEASQIDERIATESLTQCTTIERSEDTSASYLNGSRKIQKKSLQARHAIEAARSNNFTDRYNFSIGTSLGESPSATFDPNILDAIHYNAQIRRQYMEYLCDRHQCKDKIEDSRTLSCHDSNTNIGFTQAVSNDFSGYDTSSDESQQTSTHMNCVEADELSVDAWLQHSTTLAASNRTSDGGDFLSRPINVDDSILSFLNTSSEDDECVANNDEINKNRNIASQYIQNLSEYIDLAIDSLDDDDDDDLTIQDQT